MNPDYRNIERLRRATVAVGALAAFGIAEQHHDPSPVIAAIPGSSWPSPEWSVWVLWNLAAGLGCLLAAVVWPRYPTVIRAVAVIYASVILTRSVALFVEYGLDLWGTVARNILTAMLIVASWPWAGSALRAIERTK